MLNLDNFKLRLLSYLEIPDLYELMKSHYQLDILFCNEPCMLNKGTFVDKMENNYCYIGYYNLEPIGACWLSDFNYNTAQLNFTVFTREGKRNVVQLSKYLANHFIKYYDTLLAYIDSYNIEAVKIAEKCGYEKIGIIKDYYITGTEILLMQKRSFTNG